VVDGRVLPSEPFDPAAPAISASIPLLTGNMRDEATFLEMGNPAFFHMDYAALTAWARKQIGPGADSILAFYRKTRPHATPPEIGIVIETALVMGNDTTTLADRKSQQPAPVYRYRNDYESNFPIPGTDWTLRAGHATDLALTFLNYDIPDLQGNGSGLAEASRAMSGYFASFARNAVPTAAGQPDWPRYETGKRPVMLLNSQCRIVDDPDGEERRFWQSRGKGLLQAAIPY
jgi:para-nitrobenzyl esterase